MENIWMDFWYSFVNVIKSFWFNDALDIILITFIIYKVLKFARDTRSTQFIKAIVLICVVWIVSYFCHLTMMMSIMDAFFKFGIIAIIVIFQPEFRSLLERLGRSRWVTFFSGSLLSKNADDNSKELMKCVTDVCESASEMSESKTGALIVFERHSPLNEAIASGTLIDAAPSNEMIENIFFNKAPLHDGAMIIRDARIYAAGCILPLTRRMNVDSSLGTRHRAAIGLSENTDAIVVVVSEETGQISTAVGGVITRDYTRETLYDYLWTTLSQDVKDKNGKKSKKKTFRKEGHKK